MKGLHRAGHREVGLAGTGRPDAEINVVGSNVAQVARLIRTPRMHLPPPHIHHHLVPMGGDVREPRFLQVQVYPGRAQCLAVGNLVETANDLARGAHRPGVPAHVELVAAAVDFDSETLLELAKMLVERTAKLGQTTVVRRLERDAARLRAGWFGLGAQGRVMCIGSRAEERTASSSAPLVKRPRKELGRASVISTSTKRPRSDRSPEKFTTRMFSVRPQTSFRVLLRSSFDQHSLRRAQHRPAHFTGKLCDARLQDGQTAFLHRKRNRIGELCRRSARTRAVDEAEGAVESKGVDQIHGGIEVALGLAGENLR